MKIYRLYHKVDGYKAILTKGTTLESCMLENGNDAKFGSFKGQPFKWSDSTGTKICDFPFIDGNIPVMSERAYAAINSTITPCASHTNIDVEGSKYEIIEAKKISDTLDTEKSVIKYFKDGRIMNIKKYVFKSNVTYPAMFRVAELPIFTFVSEEIINKLKEVNCLDGLDTELCGIESGSRRATSL